MSEEQILKENLNTARIFLNIFGLILENKENINKDTKVKIFNKDLNEKGKLIFHDNIVIMKAKYNNSSLEAQFNFPKKSNGICSL